MFYNTQILGGSRKSLEYAGFAGYATEAAL